MATYTFYSNTSDAQIHSSNATYATARAGSGLVVEQATATTFGHGQLDFFGNHCYEQFLSFDTSSIPDGATVSSAALSLYGSSNNSATDYTAEARIKDFGATVDTTDWVAGADLGTLTLVATFDTTGWSTSAYNDFTSDAAFPGQVSKTGTTYLMVSSSRHRVGNDPTGEEYVNSYAAEDSGTTRDPKLVVVDDTPEGHPAWKRWGGVSWMGGPRTSQGGIW